MYKTASKKKLRFASTAGYLSVEQLWDISITILDKMAVKLQKEYKDSGEKSFLVKKSSKDKELKLKFDIVLDVLNTKLEEIDIESRRAEIKTHNDKILNLIADKQEDELKNKSIEELEKLIKK